MRKLTLTIAVLTVFEAAFMLSATPAAAQTTADEYRTAMKEFIPWTVAWVDETESFVSAMSAKPELACSDAYAEHLRRGLWLTEDLVGSAVNAPEAAAEINREAGEAMVEILDGAELIGHSCSGETYGKGVTKVAQGLDKFQPAIRRLQMYADGASFGTAPGPIFPIGGLIGIGG